MHAYMYVRIMCVDMYVCMRILYTRVHIYVRKLMYIFYKNFTIHSIYPKVTSAEFSL